MSAVIEADATRGGPNEYRDGTRRGRGGARAPGPGCARGGGPEGSSARLLNQARQSLLDAEWEPEPMPRFTHAYLAALRGAAAMLAARGRPHRGRAKPTSAWVLLAKVAPELAEWAGFFAAASPLNAALQAGIHKTVGQRYADDMLRQTGQFLAIVADTVGTRPQ